MSASAVTSAPLLDQMNQKFAKSVLELPVASDLPRMAPRTTIIDEQAASTILFNRSEGTVGQPKPTNAIEISKAFLMILFNHYSQDNMRLAQMASEKCVPLSLFCISLETFPFGGAF